MHRRASINCWRILQAGSTADAHNPAQEAINALLEAKQIDYVTFADWLKLDQIEQERGAALGRPRVKFSRIEDMLAGAARCQSAQRHGG